jgi:peptidoglycan/LPS O-acetylase OafA/YrhL
MLGTMLACAGSPSTFSPTLRNCQSVGGFVLIFLVVALIARDAQFPGWWAVLPTAGTALIINAGPQVWLNRTILSHPALVGIGLISYPLYLWHWPLLSFALVAEGGPPPLAVRIAAVTFSLILAFVTYKIIEKQYRRPSRNGAITPGGTFTPDGLILRSSFLRGRAVGVLCGLDSIQSAQQQGSKSGRGNHGRSR